MKDICYKGSPATAHVPRLSLTLALALACLAVLPVQAAPPEPFDITYTARYGNFKAEANRALHYDEASGHYRFTTYIALKILGGTVSSIEESSEFGWNQDLPQPLSYLYEQKGLGKRSRSLSFAPAGNSVEYTLDGKEGTVALEGPVYDDLNSYLVLQQQLANGEQTPEFAVLDRDVIKTYRYQVVDRENIETALGTFPAIHVERVRDGDSARTTDLWLAPEQGYLLLKFLQKEPGGRLIQLDIKTASLNGEQLAKR